MSMRHIVDRSDGRLQELASCYSGWRFGLGGSGHVVLRLVPGQRPMDERETVSDLLATWADRQHTLGAGAALAAGALHAGQQPERHDEPRGGE